MGDTFGAVSDELGTMNANGQATASESGNGEPGGDKAQTKGEPTGAEGLFDGMTPEQLHRSYKEIQREFGKRSETIKEFEKRFAPYGGADQVGQWVEFLSNNPRFTEWVEQEKKMRALGIEDPNLLDDESRKALGIVDNVARQRVEEEVRRRVEPLENAYKERTLSENMGKMDQKYPQWREMQDAMAELAENLPDHIQDSPSLEDLEDLYWKAIRHTGKLDDFMAKSYERKLNEKKSRSTEKPSSSTTATAVGNINSMMDAFLAAKRAG